MQVNNDKTMTALKSASTEINAFAVVEIEVEAPII